MPATPEVIALDESQFIPACRLLARAFHNDPLHSRACPNPVERARWLPHYFEGFISKSFRHGLLLGTDGDLLGVAAAIGPAAAPPIEPDGSTRDEDFTRYTAAFDLIFNLVEHELQQRVTEPHWYLDMLAVDPSVQGKGIGGLLLRSINARADQTGHPVALLTFQPENLPFYTRHGYDEVSYGIEPASGLPWWVFVRPPIR